MIRTAECVGARLIVLEPNFDLVLYNSKHCNYVRAVGSAVARRLVHKRRGAIAEARLHARFQQRTDRTHIEATALPAGEAVADRERRGTRCAPQAALAKL